jgi:hypothetical protein
LTEQAKQSIKENVQVFKRAETYAVTLYEGVIKPLMRSGREHKKIARLVCAWCGKVLNANYKTSNGLDSHGICESCAEKVRADLEK